jgi:hypothetical protein
MDSLTSQSIRLIKHCPSCQTKYAEKDAKIVAPADKDGKVLIYFNCPVCQSSLLAQMVAMPFGLFGSAALTDLEANEVKKFIHGEKVSYDDVLEVYQKLESNRGIEE